MNSFFDQLAYRQHQQAFGDFEDHYILVSTTAGGLIKLAGSEQLHHRD